MTSTFTTPLEPAAAIVDEAGTPPGDRRFRPDVQGLRAVAVVMVVLFHAGSGLSGGYVGVDVFFVISGFVITGLFLREREQSGRTSILNFYGRRSRRIVPAATLVIVVTVALAYARLGVVLGNTTADDARWTSVFLANFHFSSVGTNYLTAQQPPSPLLNFWSLAVEEQFYLVYPLVVLLIAGLRTRWSLRARLTLGLVVIVVVSFALSVAQTASDPTVAYFSPFTRAWELGIGALVAVGTNRLLTIGKPLGAALTWAGIAGILYGAVAFNNQTPYPGSLVAIPVLGAALVLAGGACAPKGGAEAVLGWKPFQWVGQLSYSIYLWHWPLLIIAADAAGKSSLPFRQNLGWLAVALLAAALSYYFVENPIRHAGLWRRRRWASVALGVGLIAASLVVATVELSTHSQQAAGLEATAGGFGDAAFPGAASSTGQVRALVTKSTQIRTLPADLTPTLAGVYDDWGGQRGACFASQSQSTIPSSCIFGDPTADRTMVLYGDSHTAMWFRAIDLIARSAHWRLIALGKGSCPTDSLPYRNPPGYENAVGEFATCDAWHTFALHRIRQIRPDLVIITQQFRPDVDNQLYSYSQWRDGLERTFSLLGVPGKDIVVIGNIPILPQSPPNCLSLHPDAVQTCGGTAPAWQIPFSRAERAAAARAGARYIDLTPWFCASTCSPVIGKYLVYWDDYHITAAYSLYLARVLQQDLPLSGSP